MWVEYIEKDGDHQQLKKMARDFQQFLNSLVGIDNQTKALDTIKNTAQIWFDSYCSNFESNEKGAKKQIELLKLLLAAPEDRTEIPNDLTKQFFTFEEKIV
jgi:hypothetical protein